MVFSDRSGAVAPRSPLSRPAVPRPGVGDGEPAPTIVVYGFADSVAALTAATSLGLPVRLKIPFVVAAALGPRVAWAIFRQASAAEPQAAATWAVDCGDETGLAVAALRVGVPEVEVDLPSEARAPIEDIARQLAARVTDRVQTAMTLDLADVEEPVAACREWLEQTARLGSAPQVALPRLDGSCI